jgi:hypothetical protein
MTRQEAVRLIEAAASRPTCSPDMGSAAGGTVSIALATISAGRGALTIATPPADLGGPSGNSRL